MADKVRNWWEQLKKSIKMSLLKVKGAGVESDLLSGMNLDLDHLYEDPSVAVSLSNQYMDNMKVLDQLKKDYKLLVDEISELQRIEMCPTKVKSELEKLANIYSETLIKKSEFRQKADGTNTHKEDYLEQYEGEMEKILKMMEEHEANQRLVKQDLAYLESEKADLVYKGRRFKSAYRVVRHAFILVAFLAAAAAFVLTLLYFVYHQSILLPAMVSMITIIAATLWVYVFRRYLHAELTKNQKLINKAVSLSNKTKIKYINNQKVIDYQCQKYKVDGAQMLRMRWENYKQRQLMAKQYKNISNSIAATMTDVEDLLRKNGLHNSEMVLDYVDYFTSKKGRVALLKKFTESKDETKSKMEDLEKENTVINLVLTNYKSRRA